MSSLSVLDFMAFAFVAIAIVAGALGVNKLSKNWHLSKEEKNRLLLPYSLVSSGGVLGLLVSSHPPQTVYVILQLVVAGILGTRIERFRSLRNFGFVK